MNERGACEPGADEASHEPATPGLLTFGTVEIEGRMPWSSNGTFLCTVTSPDDPAVFERAIYKPLRTERPLWDFPDGLYRREVAAYETAELLGWHFVPETIERSDVPLGIGSLQLFVDANFEEHYFTLLEDERHHDALRRMAVFDVIINNADRKGGHCLIDDDGRIWGIDHGLCFHPDPKLRTVIWDWAGEPIDDDVLSAVAALIERGPNGALRALLNEEEIDALWRRARGLIRRRCLPEPRSDRPYPWPLV